MVTSGTSGRVATQR